MFDIDHAVGRKPFIALWAILVTLLVTLTSSAQSPTPSPTPAPAADLMIGGYKIISSTEFGYRWRSLDGSVSKYRSDLNYRQGLRSFDTNMLLESDSGKGKAFDSLLISHSGWGSDPSGFARINVEKTGLYKADANFRRVTYFNSLTNHALNEHTQNTRHELGDVDITLLPQNDLIRFNFGASFSKNRGPGGWTVRAYSDEFPVTSETRASSSDFRIGAEGKLFGFDWGLSQGIRFFGDRSSYSLLAPSPGNNPVGTAALATFSRTLPIEGRANFTQFHVHRTFADIFDFTARLIYSSTRTTSRMIERITGRDGSNNIVDMDFFTISGDAKRPQTRGDLGLTYNATEKLRISNTFSFDKFAVNGGERFEEQLFRRNAAGNPLATTTTRSAGYRVNGYRRLVNTIEADYQFSDRVGMHIGYRFTKRNVDVMGFDQTLTSPTSPTNPRIISESEVNHTNTLIAGMKVKPVKNWVIFWDVEQGSADNVFTRLENYKFTNLRVRSRYSVKDFVFNVSAFSKDNTNPSQTIDVPPLDFGTTIDNRFYSASVDWTPRSELTIAGGYTYHHLTTDTDIRVPVASNTILQGFSQFYMRDHYAFIDVSARPHDRVLLFASYRISRDKGQGDRFSTVIQNIITSYPMRFTTPEARIAFRITPQVDWNIGYQYFNYKDIQAPTQNYRAHLPFTSLRIYFGRRAADR